MLEIDRLATGLGSVNKSEEITPTFNFDVDSHQSLIRFEGCFLDLRQILRRTALRLESKNNGFGTLARENVCITARRGVG